MTVSYGLCPKWSTTFCPPHFFSLYCPLCTQKPIPSASGKTLFVATEKRWNVVTSVLNYGKPVMIDLNTSIKKEKMPWAPLFL
jgi:hypothetical protein